MGAVRDNAASGHKDYSGTPLPTKLGVREGSRVRVLGAAAGFHLGALPPGTEILRRTRGPLDVIVLFVTKRSELSRRFAALAKSLAPAGRLWVCWPKRTSKVKTDLTFEIVQRTGLAAGLVDNKSASIDEIHQGLQFVYRLVDRPTV